MNINLPLSSTNSFRQFYLFFVIVSSQLGVGILGAPGRIFKEAHQDSLLSIIISWLVICIIISVMLIILKQYDNADIFGIQTDIFGKWIGYLLGVVYIGYFFFLNLTVLMTYIEVIQLFIFPTVPSYVLAGCMLLLIGYTISGGVRIIVGAAFLFFLATQYTLLFSYQTIQYVNWNHYLPLFQSSLGELFRGARAATFTSLGFAVLFVIYPYVNHRKKLVLPVYAGVSYTFFVLLLETFLSIGYYSLTRLPSLEWSVLTLFKSNSFSFIERMDYLLITMWMLIILSISSIFIWVMSQGFNRLFKTPKRLSTWIIIAITFIICSLFHSDIAMRAFTNYMARIGIWVEYIYPIILLPLVFIRKLVKKKMQQAK